MHTPNDQDGGVMETNPTTEMTALRARIDELQLQLREMQATISNLSFGLNRQLSEITALLQGIPVLTTISNVRYTAGNVIHSQEQNGVVMGNSKVVYGTQEDLGEDRSSPPLVPEGTELECVRCHHTWTPYARRPHLCPACRSPWWFPAKWRRGQNQPQPQE